MTENLENSELLKLPFVEVEVRFGTFNNNKFDSSVDINYFKKINSALENGTWKSIDKIFTKEYYKDQDKLRLIEFVNSEKEKLLIMKENVVNKTIQLSKYPFDIRFSVNQEFFLNSYIESFLDPIPKGSHISASGIDTSETILLREKCRHSYVSENFKYDLTYVIQTSNNVKKEKHEIELEILQNDETITWDSSYLNKFIECKVYDIMNIIEPTERNSFEITFFN
jgi:hypothetical protein